MKRAYKFRAYLTRPQEGRSARLLTDHCDLYNAALEERREAWRMGRHPIGFLDQRVQLKEIRAGDPDGQGRHSSNAQRSTLRRLDWVFQAFYKRCRTPGKKPGYPRFKSRQRFNQVTFVNGNGAMWTPAHRNGWARSYFKAVGTIKVRQCREVKGTVKALQLKQEGRRWYVIVIAETQPAPLPAAGREIGVDLGVVRFLTTSDGEVVGNPRLLASSAGVITNLQRQMDRAKPGSGNRKRLKRALAKEWRKVANRRRDFHHKTARKLINECDAIAFEKLNERGMTKRPAPKPDPEKPGSYLPNAAAGKAGLNRAILDAGWYNFIQILAGKAEEAARRVIFVNAAGTSITCHQCGRRCERPQRALVICPVHGAMDADVNGARNVYTRAGLGSGQDVQAA